MASTSNQAGDAAVRRNLLALSKQVYHITFDLNGTDYIPNAKIGAGAYGVVCSATHRKTKENVAIKKTPNCFVRQDLAMRTYRELKILRHFKHDNIISIREILKPNTPDFRDVYMVLDLMESDLHQIIHTNDPLSDEHVRYFLYQILRGLKYIHSANVIHRDLKPSNLLVNSNCELKIGDFGMARGIASGPDEQPNSFMTQYVSTRWYRAPELMFHHMKYSTAVDVWSVGCIFAEMLGRKQLFPGRDVIHQLNLITSTLGTPSKEFLNKTNSDMDRFRDFAIGMGPKKAVPFKTLYPTAPKKALDLLSKMLEFIPNDRANVEKALKHPYLTTYHDPDDEPVCGHLFNFDFEKELKSGEAIKKSVLKEIEEDMHRQNRGPTTSHNSPASKDVIIHDYSLPSSTENSAVLISNTEKMIRDLGELAKQQNSHIALNNAEQQKRESKDQQVPDVSIAPGPHSTLTVDASKTTDDVEMLSAKTSALTISNEDKEIRSKEEQTGDNSQKLKVDVSKTTDDVEMLSAKTSAMKIDCQSDLTCDGGKEVPAKEISSSDASVLSLLSTSDVRSSNANMHAAKRDDNLGLLPSVVQHNDKPTVAEKPLDAKALIKAAILNGRKARSMSESSENAKPKVTALQRQKQREDKRKKKQERAVLRKKKKGQVENKVEISLSDADRNLLERWQSMQTTKKPIENKPSSIDPSSYQQFNTVPIGHNPALIPTGIGVVQPPNGVVQTVIPQQMPTNTAPHSMHTQNMLHLNPPVETLGKSTSESLRQSKGITGLSNQISPEIIRQISANLNVVDMPGNRANSTSITQPTGSLDIAHQPINLLPNQSIQQPTMDSFLPSMHDPHRHIPSMVAHSQSINLGVQNVVGPSQIITNCRDQPVQGSHGRISAAGHLVSDASVNPWDLPGLTHNDSQRSLGECPAPHLVPPLLHSFSGLEGDSSDPSLVTLPDGWLGPSPTGSPNDPPPYSNTVKLDNFLGPVDKGYAPSDVMISGHMAPKQTLSHSDSLPASNLQRLDSTKGIVNLAVSIPKNINAQPIYKTQDHTFTQTLNIPYSGPHGLSPLKAGYRTLNLTPEHLNLVSQHRLQTQRPPVDDLNLVQTPKGTGAGYGVGLDLDLLLRESVPMEQSEDKNSELDPLSATLLADWQEELRNIDPRDLEALEHDLQMGFPSPIINTTPSHS